MSQIFRSRYLSATAVGNDSKSSPPRAVDMLEICGRERIWLNSACDWGISDPLAVPKTAIEMRHRGYSAEFVDQILFQNPVRFLSQCPKFSVPVT